jgi:DNA repair protein RadC
VAHNHPGGSLKPSQADIRLTKKLASGLEQIGLRLDDHIILTVSNWASLKEEGLIT